jgi:hypothetical protein
MVRKPYGVIISAGTKAQRRIKASPFNSSRIKTNAFMTMIVRVIFGKYIGRRVESPSGIMVALVQIF